MTNLELLFDRRNYKKNVSRVKTTRVWV